MSLASLAAFQLQAGAGDSSAADQAVLDAADAAVKSWIRWNPEQATYTKYLDGTGTPELVLPGLPVTQTITTVHLDTLGGYGQVPDSFAAATLLTLGVNYLHDAERGVLRMWRVPTTAFLGWPAVVGPGLAWAGLTTHGARPAYWPRIPGCVKVVWQNGYAAGSVPADLAAAVVQLAAWLRENQPTGGLFENSQNYIDASTGLAQYAAEVIGSLSVPAMGTVRQLLASYREPVIAGGIR